ncbi:MAG: hypothetical protein WBQ89_18200 [Candidatus Acidiferrum sp.]
MKRLIFALFAALLLTTLGPLPVVSAHNWWWHHRSRPAPAGVGASNKDKRTKVQREKRQHGKLEALYTSPKSIGWWHKNPGPMGAGSGASKDTKTQTAHHEKHNKNTSAQASTGHKSLFWWRHHDAPPPATATPTAPTTASSSDGATN